MTHDPQNMLEVVRSSPDLWAQGSDIAAQIAPWDVGGARAAVVAGMGGSGIAGDVAVLTAAVRGNAPVVVVKGYELPAWAGPDTPVVVVSHSGNTEETVAVAQAALAAGSPIAAVTSGGALAGMVRAAGGPVVTVPGDHQPRASFPLLAAPTIGLLEVAGVLAGQRDALRAVADVLAGRIAALDAQAVADAERLRDRVPVFVGGVGVAALVAARGKCQINENAEMPAFANELPEANHNEVVGWGGGPDVAYTIVPIRDAEGAEHPRVAKRFAITGGLLAGVADVVSGFRLPAGDLFVRLATGVAYVDLLSVHLALQTGVDPTPVERISDLKRQMEAV